MLRPRPHICVYFALKELPAWILMFTKLWQVCTENWNVPWFTTESQVSVSFAKASVKYGALRELCCDGGLVRTAV